MPITFELQTIDILAANEENPAEIKMHPILATVGVGTGLAYHHLGNDPLNGYVLTHVSSGSRIGSGDDVDTEEEARRWLELCAPLMDWGSNLQQLAKTLDRAAMKVSVYEACEQAKAEHLERTRNQIVEYPCTFLLSMADFDKLAREANIYSCTIDTFLLKLVQAYIRDEITLTQPGEEP